MNERGKSDGCVVPAKPANKAATAVAESVEEGAQPRGTRTVKHIPDAGPESVCHVIWTVCVRLLFEINRCGSPP